MAKKLSYKQLKKEVKRYKKNELKKFDQLIKNSFDMLVLLDANGVQQYVSESCQRILGYKPEELNNISVIEEMIHPDDQQKTIEGFQDVVKHGFNKGTQYRHRHKNGEWVYLEAVGTNQIDNPLINKIVLNVRDITDHKLKEQELLASQERLSEANKTKDRFFSIIGHDMKGPFNSIVGFSDILLDQLANEDYEGVESYARIIHESSQRAMNLLNNLLEWSRAQTGKIQYSPEYIEFVSLANEVIDLMKDCALEKSITVNHKLPHDLPILADKSMIKAILRNLISNAVKFTDEGGEITVLSNVDSEYITISVVDNGVGIKPENVKKLFRIDYSFSTPGTNDETGTGLGLLLCKEFVEMHGGKLWVESVYGSGSTFKFTIPKHNLS